MSTANTTIQLKKSGASGNTPSNLNFGEVALNYADGKLYYKDDSGNTSFIKNSNSFSTIVANSYSLVAGTNTDVLNLESANGSYGIDITANTQSKTITITDSDTQTLIGEVNDYVASAYNKANNLAVQIASVGEVSNTYYISFAGDNNSMSNTLYGTANNTLTFKPSEGKLDVRSIDLTSNTNIVAKTVVVPDINPIVVDSFSINEFRSAFYQIQISRPSSFHYHSLNFNVVHDGYFPITSTFGEVYTGSLGSFYASIFGSTLEVTFYPSIGASTVVLTRYAVDTSPIQGTPEDSMGLVGDTPTSRYNSGSVTELPTLILDYGTVN
jgi:hypothetical protein